MVDFINKFYELEMKICAKEARRLKSTDTDTDTEKFKNGYGYGYKKV